MTAAHLLRPVKPKAKTPAPTFTRIAEPSTRDNTYRTGDGETPFITRPGSMDAYKLPSRGNRT